MTDSTALFDALERALGAHAAALTSPDPLALERANGELGALLSTLRSELRRKPGVDADAAALEQLRARFVAHGAVVARIASGNRAALMAMGLADPPHTLYPTIGRHRRATHLLA